MPYPAPAQRHSPLPLASACLAHAPSPRTLLLVEDSRLAAEAVRLICRRAGIRLRRAETLQSALLHLKVYRPDIAMIDLGLPDGSGLDLIAALSNRSERPGRIVAVSGEDGLKDTALAAGAEAFLLKPISIQRHLTALTGAEDNPGALPDQMTSRSEPEAGSRNAGADPLALRDDLRMVRDMVQGRPGAAQLRYAGQFLASIGRALGDDGLASAALRAARAGDRKALFALADARDPLGPVL
tara:strand:- start:1896 stop:2618 length:723 start_codon:yes stop_codon:yes gene_type:complete